MSKWDDFSDEDMDRIGSQAAEWLMKRDRGFTARDQDEFFQWLVADPRHGEWFARHRALWRRFDTLAQWRPEHSEEPNPDLLARSRRVFPWAVWTFAAAACLAIVGGFVWQIRKTSTTANAPVFAQAYEKRFLEDGSVIELKRGAVVEVRFTTEERRVSLLRGEASFTVAKNKNRPFIVRASGVDVRAVGTVFNVKLTEGLVDVLVSEGKVHVSPPGPSTVSDGTRVIADEPIVAAGQRAIVSLAPDAPPPRVLPVTASEMAESLDWQPRTIDSESKPLREIVANFNEYNRTKLILADLEIGQLLIVASFHSDNIEGFVRLLEQTMGIEASRRENGDIELRKAR